MGKEPSILYFLETEIHSTGKRRTLKSGERACNQLKWVSKVKVGPSPLGICVASRLFCPLQREAFVIKRVSGRGEYCRVLHFIAFHWESLRHYCVCHISMRYFCNCGISKHAEFFVIGSAIFSMVVSNFSIFHCSVTVFGIPLAALQLFFAHAYTSATRPALIVWYRDQLRF